MACKSIYIAELWEHTCKPQRIGVQRGNDTSRIGGVSRGVSQVAYLSQVGGSGHNEDPRLCPHYNSITVYSAVWTQGASTASPDWQIGSNHPSPHEEQVFQLVTVEMEGGSEGRSVHGVQHKHGREREIENNRREKRFPSPCVPSMHNYNAITKEQLPL